MAQQLEFPTDIEVVVGQFGLDFDSTDKLDGRTPGIDGPLSNSEAGLLKRTNFLYNRVMEHRKSEVLWSGLNIALQQTPLNLVTILKATAPASGSLSPFFNTTTDKLTVFNENVKLGFKLVLKGTFSGGINPRTVSLSFTGAVPDIITANRSNDVTPDYLTFITFFSVDKNGFLATNGSTMELLNSSGTFTITDVKLIAEQ